MNGLLVVLAAAVVLAVGYLFYGRWLARTWGVDAEALTPARRMEDGKNFSPASCFTVFSHQFSSICGAGPVRASRCSRISSAPSAARALSRVLSPP